MPLLNGSSDAIIANNIQEILDAYKEKGQIGKVTPKDAAHAQRIAIAIAYSKAGRERPNATPKTKVAKVSRPRIKKQTSSIVKGPTKPKTLGRPFFPRKI